MFNTPNGIHFSQGNTRLTADKAPDAGDWSNLVLGIGLGPGDYVDVNFKNKLETKLYNEL